MAKPTFTFENYAPAGNTLYDLYRYYLDPSAYDDDEEEVLNPGLAPFFGIGAQTIGGQGQDDTSNIWNYAAQQVVEEARREHLLRNSLVPTSIGAMTGADAGWQVTEDAIIAQQMKDAWSEGHDDARRAAIRAAMIAGNHSEDVIAETFALLGLKDGGVVKMKDGGIMDLGGKEMDLRGGGFVPIGKKERADDVPARLSKNEFVMTADAVRAAGGGDINKGAKRMYETMNRLEARA